MPDLSVKPYTLTEQTKKTNRVLKGALIAVGIKAVIDAALFTPTNKDEFIRTMKEGGRYVIEATFLLP